MRFRTASIALSVAIPSLMVASFGAPAAGSSSQFDRYTAWEKVDSAGEIEAPRTPNPYVANLASGDADYRSWQAFAAHDDKGNNGKNDRNGRGGKVKIRSVREHKSNNDTPDRGQRIILDTKRGSAGVDIAGNGPNTRPGTTTDVGFTPEPGGSLVDAALLPGLDAGDSAVGTGVIGDDGDDFDFDFFQLDGVAAGDTIVFDIDTPDSFADLDSFVAIWDGNGPFPIADNDDAGGPDGVDSRLTFEVPADGTYWLSVAGFGAFIPADPFDPNSPSITGDPGSQGEYSFTVSVVDVDVDYYRFKAAAGDVVGVTAFGASGVEFRAPDGSLLIGSSQDLTFIHPPSSPLPGGGNASASYVLSEAGNYTVGIKTSDDYEAQVRAFRPLGDAEDRGTQVLFLDFDGGALDPGIFFDGPFGFEVPLSPLATYLSAWGLGPGDEDAVIDSVVDAVTENLDADLRQLGLNDSFDIEVRNSRDEADPWGQPNVSRIIVGGGILEVGIETIGIAQSIDVGNFETEESAVVLLDLLSGTGPFPAPDVDLNNFALAPGTSIVELVGTAVGNITAHEAGHFFANWHTDQFNDNPNIQDQGGNLPATVLGIGDDFVFGTADDVDVDFGVDVFVPAEGFTGVEDTLNSIAFGLWSSENGG